jgi:hypothetical protein
MVVGNGRERAGFGVVKSRCCDVVGFKPPLLATVPVRLQPCHTTCGFLLEKHPHERGQGNQVCFLFFCCSKELHRMILR